MPELFSDIKSQLFKTLHSILNTTRLFPHSHRVKRAQFLKEPYAVMITKGQNCYRTNAKYSQAFSQSCSIVTHRVSHELFYIDCSSYCAVGVLHSNKIYAGWRLFQLFWITTHKARVHLSTFHFAPGCYSAHIMLQSCRFVRRSISIFGNHYSSVI